MERMRFFKGRNIILKALVLLIIGCAVNRFSENRAIESMVEHDFLDISLHADKVSYSSMHRTFFALNKQENSIYIYKNGVFFNIIGRSGFSDDNFRRLSDIYYGVDGFLYALDSFEKSIKKFDSDGKYIGQASINQISSPERFVMTQYGSFFIFDGHSKEIIYLDPFDYSPKFTFGRFQIDSVDMMFIMGDYLNIFDKDRNITDIFYINGKHENSYRGLTFYDLFRNVLSFTDEGFRDIRRDMAVYSIPSGSFASFNIENGFYLLQSENWVRVLRVVYEM